MKTQNTPWLVVLLIICAQINACPTCIGRINQADAPFFSDEFYQKNISPNYMSGSITAEDNITNQDYIDTLEEDEDEEL